MPAPREVWIDIDTNTEFVIDIVDENSERIERVVLHDSTGASVECSEAEFFQQFRRKAA